MYLRTLELKDAPLMLAWMHDRSVTKDLRTNFMSIFCQGLKGLQLKKHGEEGILRMIQLWEHPSMLNWFQLVINHMVF